HVHEHHWAQPRRHRGHRHHRQRLHCHVRQRGPALPRVVQDREPGAVHVEGRRQEDRVMARDFLPRQDVQIADPSGRTTTPFYVWMQSLERAFGALDVDLAALLEQIEQLKPGQKLTIDGAMSVIVTNIDGTITISLDGDNDSPGGNWYYGTNEAGVRGCWPIADGDSGGYSITKAVDYGPYDFQGELDTQDDLPYPVVVDDAYLINGDLWVGVDDGGDDGPGWDNLGPAPTTAVLSLINDEATPDPTHYY